MADPANELIVEDGSGVAGANAYASVATIEAYANARGITLNGDASVGAILAMDYIESKKQQYKGMPTYVPGLAWPRGGIVNYEPQYNSAYLTGFELEAFFQMGLFSDYSYSPYWYCGYWNNLMSATEVPPEIVSAFCYLAIQATNNVNLMPDQSQPFLQQQSIGQAGLVQIWNADKITPQPKFILVDRMLRPFMKEESALRSRRA